MSRRSGACSVTVDESTPVRRRGRRQPGVVLVVGPPVSGRQSDRDESCRKEMVDVQGTVRRVLGQIRSPSPSNFREARRTPCRSL